MADRASSRAAARHVERDPDARDTALHHLTPLPATGAPASILCKERVRAALFRKLELVRIGRFILMEQLDANAMGEIYAAYDDQLDRKVALKLVKSSAGHGKRDEQLLREAQTLARLSHPNVVQVYEVGTYHGRLFIATELIRGKTLTSWLKDAEQVPRAMRQREILRQFIAAGRGLEAAHAAGLAHRDFKPDNVLVGNDGRVCVVDFGLARALVNDPDAGPSTGSRSDQFSFCVALYHALCGVYPFAGDTWWDLQSSVERGEVQPALNVQVPAFVRGALRRGLSVDPSQRFPSMGELLAALEPSSRRKWIWIAAAAALVAVGLGAGVYARSNAQVDPCTNAGAAIDASWSADRQATLPEATAACRASNVAHPRSAR